MSITRQSTLKSFAQQEPLHLEIIPAEKAAVLTIRSFDFVQRRREFKSFVDRSFDSVRMDDVNNLILDLRDNTGGDPVCASYLLSHLIANDVAYFSRPYPEYDLLSKPVSRSSTCFTGNIFTLVNGMSLSTTGHLSALLKYHCIGTFIGTATGGTYTCNDGAKVYRLRNSGLLLRIANKTYTVATNNLDRFEGIEPDHIVNETLSDIMNKRDAGREFAMQLIKSRSANRHHDKEE